MVYIFVWVMLMEQNNVIDVICQHNKDGTIIPLRIRLQDEDKVVQTYTIKSYRELSSEETRLPSEVVVTTNILRYDCRINVFGYEKRVVLHYNKSQVKWSIFY